MLINITTEFFNNVYSEIQKQNSSSSQSALIFVSSNVDAICACKILTTLLRCNDIKFKVVPIQSNEQLREHHKQHTKGSTEHKSVFLLNCGGSLDLETFLSIELNREQKSATGNHHEDEAYDSSDDYDMDEKIERTYYVLDNRRPFHLFNVFETTKETLNHIVLLTSEPKEQESFTKDWKAIVKSKAFVDYHEKQEQLEQSITTASQTKEQETSNSTHPQDEDPYFEDGDDEDDEGDDLGGFIVNDDDEEEDRKYYESKLEEYYTLNYFVTPSSVSLCMAILKDHKMDLPRDICNDMLWWSIIGLTEHFVFDRIEPATYQTLVQTLYMEVLKRNSKTAPTVELESGIVIPINNDERIAYVQHEMRFVLYRHWSLFESMFHSPYVATRLRTWKEQGRETMKLLLASMGIRLDETQQSYQNMNPQYKNKFIGRLQQIGKQFNLGDVFFSSFVRQYGAQLQVSASDMVYAIASMLDANQEKNFWNAYNALSGNIKLISQAISIAIGLQQLLVAQVVSVMERRAVSNYKKFKWTTITTVSDALLRTPLTISRLALFLSAAIQDSKKGESGSNRIPFLLGLKNASKGTFYVVGVSQDRVANKFGAAFRKANENVNAQLEHVGFETALVEVKADTFSDFIDALFCLTNARH